MQVCVNNITTLHNPTSITFCIIFICLAVCVLWLYYKTIDNLKTAAEFSTTKLRHQYYILKMYEVLQCGDVDKLIKKRKSPEDFIIVITNDKVPYNTLNNDELSTNISHSVISRNNWSLISVIS